LVSKLLAIFTFKDNLIVNLGIFKISEKVWFVMGIDDGVFSVTWLVAFWQNHGTVVIQDPLTANNAAFFDREVDREGRNRDIFNLIVGFSGMGLFKSILLKSVFDLAAKTYGH